jgi:hypothetical protein
MKAVLITVLGCSLVSCSTLPSHEEYRRNLQARLGAVVVEDGVSAQESKVIAEEYLYEHMAASLGHVGPYDGRAFWVFNITMDVVPIVLSNIPPVLVDKNTGVVTWEATPPLKK